MTTIADVRSAMAEAIKTTGLSASPYARATPTPPIAWVLRPAYDPRFVFGERKVDYKFKVLVFAGGVEDQAAQTLLDAYCEPSGGVSLVQALQDGANWPADLVDMVQVVNVGENLVQQLADGSTYWTVELDVEVIW